MPIAPSQEVQRTTRRHVPHATRRALPLVFKITATRRFRSRIAAITSLDNNDEPHRSSLVLSSTTTFGQPEPHLSSRESTVCALCVAMQLGTADVSSTGIPARTPRSMATSRAFHVGMRSSWWDSSCSSMTTSTARFGTDAHTAARAPMTTSTPPAARAHSSGYTAVVSPTRRIAAASPLALACVGITTMAGPAWCIPATIVVKSTSGPRIKSVTPFREAASFAPWSIVSAATRAEEY